MLIAEINLDTVTAKVNWSVGKKGPLSVTSAGWDLIINVNLQKKTALLGWVSGRLNTDLIAINAPTTGVTLIKRLVVYRVDGAVRN